MQWTTNNAALSFTLSATYPDGTALSQPLTLTAGGAAPTSGPLPLGSYAGDGAIANVANGIGAYFTTLPISLAQASSGQPIYVVILSCNTLGACASSNVVTLNVCRESCAKFLPVCPPLPVRG